jgi:hypothetical protein
MYFELFEKIDEATDVALARSGTSAANADSTQPRWLRRSSRYYAPDTIKSK